VTQEKRNLSRRRAILWLGLAVSTVVVAGALVTAGCGRGGLPPSVREPPGLSSCTYWVWDAADLAASLQPAAPMTDRWAEFLDASADHRVLIHDFQFLEGHPDAVQPAWNEKHPPKVAETPWISYRSAGRWVAGDHVAPNSVSLLFLRLPDGGRIDTSDPEAWRYPVGTEIVQLIYRRDIAGASTVPTTATGRRAVLVEWRRMRMAGRERGQMRTDGSRSDWVFESAVRDPADGLWRRTREDHRDVRWVRMGRPGNRFDWPVVRPHTCAECHRMAGRSPFDGPRGGNDVYSLGDLREVVWTDQVATLTPLMTQPPDEAAVAAARQQQLPPDRAERFDAYIRALAEQRGKDPVLVRAQQQLLDASPFVRGDPQAVSRGRDIYLAQCAGCHGAEARGNGPFALRHPSPPALGGLKDKAILDAIRRGRDTMPAFVGTLPGDEQWRLVEYLRTLSR